MPTPRVNRAVSTTLATLRADFEEITGRPFTHFACPILFRDEPARLCRGHIVNTALKGSYGHWTVMRCDVDEFFGSVCESDFVLLNDWTSLPVADVVADKRLSRFLKPALSVGGSVIPHYLPAGQIPREHTEFTLERPGREPFRLALRRSSDSLFAAGGFEWRIRLSTPVATGAVASLLKAAHLTMFARMGYSYALSPGGRFIGHDVLGRFYEQNVGLSRRDASANASRHFTRYACLVRPVTGDVPRFKGTIHDGMLYQCADGGPPWANVALVRAGSTLYAVLLPTLDSAVNRDRFAAFLADPSTSLEVRRASCRRRRWQISEERRTIPWTVAGAA